jgi:hypothetical protein
MTRTFQPSEFSPLGDAGGAGASTTYVDVDDGGGTLWRVYEDKSVKGLKSSTYPSVVNQTTTWPSSSQILSNLRAASSSNATKIDNVTGGGLSLPTPWSSGGGSKPAPAALAAIEGPEPSVPLTDRVWFWPTVILTSTTLISGVIWYVYTKKTGHTVKQQYAQLQRAAEL